MREIKLTELEQYIRCKLDLRDDLKDAIKATKKHLRWQDTLYVRDGYVNLVNHPSVSYEVIGDALCYKYIDYPGVIFIHRGDAVTIANDPKGLEGVEDAVAPSRKSTFEGLLLCKEEPGPALINPEAVGKLIHNKAEYLRGPTKKINTAPIRKDTPTPGTFVKGYERWLGTETLDRLKAIETRPFPLMGVDPAKEFPHSDVDTDEEVALKTAAKELHDRFKDCMFGEYIIDAVKAKLRGPNGTWYLAVFSKSLAGKLRVTSVKPHRILAPGQNAKLLLHDAMVDRLGERRYTDRDFDRQPDSVGAVLNEQFRGKNYGDWKVLKVWGTEKDVILHVRLTKSARTPRDESEYVEMRPRTEEMWGRHESPDIAKRLHTWLEGVALGKYLEDKKEHWIGEFVGRRYGMGPWVVTSVRFRRSDALHRYLVVEYTNGIKTYSRMVRQEELPGYKYSEEGLHEHLLKVLR